MYKAKSWFLENKKRYKKYPNVKSCSGGKENYDKSINQTNNRSMNK